MKNNNSTNYQTPQEILNNNAHPKKVLSLADQLFSNIVRNFQRKKNKKFYKEREKKIILN